MIDNKLRKFFYPNEENEFILKHFEIDELNAIRNFLTYKDPELKDKYCKELMIKTIQKISPDFCIFEELLEEEINNFINMEKGVIYLKQDYRSHFIHSSYVYLLGFYLLQNRYLTPQFLQTGNISYYDRTFRNKPIFSRKPATANLDEALEFKNRWALAAFFHDVAYLSELNMTIMDNQAKKILNQEKVYDFLPTINSRPSQKTRIYWKTRTCRM